MILPWASFTFAFATKTKSICSYSLDFSNALKPNNERSSSSCLFFSLLATYLLYILLERVEVNRVMSSRRRKNRATEDLNEKWRERPTSPSSKKEVVFRWREMLIVTTERATVSDDSVRFPLLYIQHVFRSVCYIASVSKLMFRDKLFSIADWMTVERRRVSEGGTPGVKIPPHTRYDIDYTHINHHTHNMLNTPECIPLQYLPFTTISVGFVSPNCTSFWSLSLSITLAFRGLCSATYSLLVLIWFERELNTTCVQATQSQAILFHRVAHIRVYYSHESDSLSLLPSVSLFRHSPPLPYTRSPVSKRNENEAFCYVIGLLMLSRPKLKQLWCKDKSIPEEGEL